MLSNMYNARLFSFLGVCTESSRTSSEDSEQGENTHLPVGQSGQDSPYTSHCFIFVIGHNVAL